MQYLESTEYSTEMQLRVHTSTRNIFRFFTFCIPRLYTHKAIVVDEDLPLALSQSRLVTNKTRRKWSTRQQQYMHVVCVSGLVSLRLTKSSETRGLMGYTESVEIDEVNLLYRTQNFTYSGVRCATRLLVRVRKQPYVMGRSLVPSQSRK